MTSPLLGRALLPKSRQPKPGFRGQLIPMMAAAASKAKGAQPVENRYAIVTPIV
jgi:hypothetical protein